MPDFEKQWIYQQCPQCHGDGIISCGGLLEGIEVIAEEFTCPSCDGLGEVKWGFLKVPIAP